MNKINLLLTLILALNSSIAAEFYGGGSVSTGNVNNMNDLAISSYNNDLRSVSKKLIIHETYWINTNSTNRTSIASLFNDKPIYETGLPQAEYSLDTFLKPYYPGGAKYTIVNYAFPDGVHLFDINDPNLAVSLQDYKNKVDSITGNFPGTSTPRTEKVAMLYAPNNYQWQNAPWDTDPKWSILKQKILYCGVLAVDAPSDFYFFMPAGYRDWIEDQYDWCVANNVEYISLISPGIWGNSFNVDSYNFVADIEDRGIKPDAYAVYNYFDASFTNVNRVTGNEDDNTSIMYVVNQLAHRLLQYPPFQISKSPNAEFVNISIRGKVTPFVNSIVTGLVTQNKPGLSGNFDFMVNGKGPSMGISQAISDPYVEVFSGTTQIAYNDNWGTSPEYNDIVASGFAPTNSNEATVYLKNKAPGAYTMNVNSTVSGGSIALAELYKVGSSANVEIVNFSCLADVGTLANNENLIAGFVVQGGPARILITAKSTTLQQYGVTGTLADPIIDVRNINNGYTIINDDWESLWNSDDIAALPAIFVPGHSEESALYEVFPPGVYTVSVTGKNSGIGKAIIEINLL